MQLKEVDSWIKHAHETVVSISRKCSFKVQYCYLMNMAVYNLRTDSYCSVFYGLFCIKFKNNFIYKTLLNLQHLLLLISVLYAIKPPITYISIPFLQKLQCTFTVAGDSRDVSKEVRDSSLWQTVFIKSFIVRKRINLYSQKKNYSSLINTQLFVQDDWIILTKIWIQITWRGTGILIRIIKRWSLVL